ncbi:MAG: hypothetical protein C5B48_13415 [Candidatus Rokuibacteriota bacterium]|nr:MAG: hypothetical protein C5B48_13415 [Candidatus Rokubacteria bacterium]
MRVPGVDERRQDVVIDLDQLARVDRDGAIDRDDDRHRLTGVADTVGRERRLKIGRVHCLCALAYRNARHAGEIGRGQTREHAGMSESTSPVHAANSRMGVRAAHDDSVRHPGAREVIHVPAAADKEAGIFEASDRRADHHVKILPWAYADSPGPDRAMYRFRDVDRLSGGGVGFMP